MHKIESSCEFHPHMLGESAAQELYKMLDFTVSVSYLDRRVLGNMHKCVHSLPFPWELDLCLPRISAYGATFNSLANQILKKQHAVVCGCNVCRRRYIVHEDVDTIMVDAEPLSSIGIKRQLVEDYVPSASKRRRTDSLSSNAAADYYAMDVLSAPLLSPYSSPSPPSSPTLSNVSSSSSLSTEKRKREPEHEQNQDDVQPPEKRIKQEKVEGHLFPCRPKGELAIKRSSVMEKELLARKRRRTNPTTPFATFKERHDVLEVVLTFSPYENTIWNVKPRAHVRHHVYANIDRD
jgi:hypothetical protein